MLRKSIAFVLFSGALAMAGPVAAAHRHAAPPAGINQTVLQEQVLLDRAGFSPGAIDGRGGDNTDKALFAFEQINGLPAGPPSQAVWARLLQVPGGPILARYTIQPQDVQGPFVPRIPDQYAEMARLPRLFYRTPQQELSERFHMSEQLLAELNPGTNFAQPGTPITVANVGGTDPEAVAQSGRHGPDAGDAAGRSGSSGGENAAARVVVDKRHADVLVFGSGNRLLAFFPATIGSVAQPAPSGTFRVETIVRNPTYTYRPSLHFTRQNAQKPVTVPPGPNNPVGLVWIGLSAKGYGIHGTPDPTKVGKSFSHGCIHLTNWDMLLLARMVQKGTPVDFVG
ncbi:MAG TPA: L,D-transpeptidase family protein [Stellaceae bacterium]|nr:L,D-transpeptidase family protein [Stellaceae bacterium]